MARYIIEDRSGDLIRFESKGAALQHCRDDEFIPSEVIWQDGREYQDYSDDFEEDLKIFAPHLFDFDQAYDMAAE